MASPSDHDPDTTPPLTEGDVPQPLLRSSIGSGLLAQQPTPSADEAVAVARVCPQCGGEYDTADRFCPKDGTPLRPKAGGDPMIGRVIAERYLILARLGEGGMGRVYLGEHVKMNRQCAVKVMNPQLVTDQESLQRFAREASSAARIIHPNVAAVFDYGESEKVVYLVMEYVDGESLSTVLAREGAMDPRRAIDIAKQIADGLHAAHELGIIHRDLKPDNVIITRSKSGKEIPKVVDFGIAKAMTDEAQDALTRSGLVIGTPEFMSPEQLLGDPVDARADIYSLGCILYQMLSGEPAFAADSREQMIRRRLHEPPPHVRDLRPDVPRRLDTLITHMLARSPGDRIASAAEVSHALEPARALGGWDRGGNAVRPTPSVRATPNDPTLQPTMPMAKFVTKPIKRVSLKRVAGGVVVGVALLAGGLALWQVSEFDPSAFFSRNLETRHQQTAAPTPPPVADTFGVKKPAALPPLDSISQKKKADSIAAAQKAAAAAAAQAKLGAPGSVTERLERLTRAFGSGDIERVGQLFPQMSQDQREKFQTLFSQVKSLHATATYGLPPVPVGDAKDDVVDLDYVVNLNYVLSGTPQSSPIRYRARLHWTPAFKTWQIQSLTPIDKP
jgi:serine/threonine-protein kinase